MADEQAPPFMSRQQAGDGGVSKVRASWDENEEQTRMETPQQPAFFFCFGAVGTFGRRQDIYLGVGLAQSIAGRAAHPCIHGNLSTVAQSHKNSNHLNKFPEQTDEN